MRGGCLSLMRGVWIWRGASGMGGQEFMYVLIVKAGFNKYTHKEDIVLQLFGVKKLTA